VEAAAQTEWVVEQAHQIGFDLCGVVRLEDLERSEELARLPEWLERGHAGEMAYLHDQRRRSPARVLAGARSIIVCALNYNTSLPYSTEVPPEEPGDVPRGWISRYAWGDDYHQVMSEKLEALVRALRERIARPFEARAYVDTGPVVERVAAKYAGLGWLAKNTCLIHPQLGSWLFLGLVLTTLDLAPSLDAAAPGRSEPPPDLCGNCRLCIEACPSGAIVEPYLLDARRCISYLTIELRGSIPAELRPAMGRQVFGCDICQDVCPWNRAAPATDLAAFRARSAATEEPLLAPSLERLVSLNEEEFREVFRGSAVKRTKWRGLVRNACVALGNSGLRPGTPAHTRSVAQLERLAWSEDEVIAEHARWALERLRAA